MSEEKLKSIDPEMATGFLVGRVAHQLQLRLATALYDAGISLSAEGVSILTALANMDSAKKMSELAEILGRDATTLKRQLDGLVKAGLVERIPSVTDRRVVEVSVSAKGRQLVASSMPVTMALRKQAMHGISKAKERELKAMLVRMLENLAG
ncbi:MarR family winged helix-turn-helix transcriptional regulator [Persicirhabdus sediminis]|uniref:MarR family transcriptional regulator n=1 Tax=Persicirhabdus sediminis TaxID=454144 RepID=A0A8J7MDU4_9BACT|nr:MarR family transcriptional regulator [Persicirhabdus sediminis]MBK1790861.1 MarR family transcriptional regulator [Persicirhabdus sediminis]